MKKSLLLFGILTLVQISVKSQCLAPTTTNDTICTNNTGTLTASGGATHVWFAQSTGGTPLDTGNTFLTPNLTASTNYYVSSICSDSLPLILPSQSGTYSGLTRGYYFIAPIDFVITSLKVPAIVEGELSTALVSGNTYEIKFYVSLADNCTYATDNLGIKFTTTRQSFNNACYWNTTPDANFSDFWTVFDDKDNWTLIQFSFTPSVSGLKYFTIGNFFSDNNTTWDNTLSGSIANTVYFVDDVSIIDQTTLPIELTFFSASLKNDQVMLNWQTASEVNNEKFIVERSSDANKWEPIINKKGAGYSSITLNYNAIDANPLDGRNYYRLKQVDFDGNFSYSNIGVVNYLNDGLYLFPNPSSGIFWVKNSNGDLFSINVFDMAGKNIFQLQTNKEKIDLSALNNGVYGIQLINNNNSIFKKIILER